MEREEAEKKNLESELEELKKVMKDQEKRMKAAENEVERVQQLRVDLPIERDTTRNTRRQAVANLDDEKTKNIKLRL
ncbi:hypothetical protein Dimus_029624, partial [Dionaea muscipula]